MTRYALIRRVNREGLTIRVSDDAPNCDYRTINRRCNVLKLGCGQACGQRVEYLRTAQDGLLITCA